MTYLPAEERARQRRPGGAAEDLAEGPCSESCCDFSTHLHARFVMTKINLHAIIIIVSMVHHSGYTLSTRISTSVIIITVMIALP